MQHHSDTCSQHPDDLLCKIPYPEHTTLHKIPMKLQISRTFIRQVLLLLLMLLLLLLPTMLRVRQQPL